MKEREAEKEESGKMTQDYGRVSEDMNEQSGKNNIGVTIS